MVVAVFLIPWFHFDRVNFSDLFYGSGRMDVIYIGIDVAEPFAADEFFPIKITIIIPELDVPFVWKLSS
jgi:hypothetical protein